MKPVGGPWGSETQIRARRKPVVLVDEPAEQVPPVDTSAADGDRVPGLGLRDRKGEPAVGPSAVVVLDSPWPGSEPAASPTPSAGVPSGGSRRFAGCRAR
jgi:hypothetical protein